MDTQAVLLVLVFCFLLFANAEEVQMDAESLGERGISQLL
jgi:hypothetical protein